MSYNDRSSSGRRLRPSRQAQTSINEAFERLQNSISKDDQRLFNSTKLKDVYETARDVENQLGARRELRYMRRLEPFFNWLLQYSKEMEILCNGTPYLPWIWHVNSLNAIQRSFCSQLLEADRSLSSFIYDEYVSENKAASNQVLSEVLRKLLSTLDNVRIVIDGIDEWDARHAKKILIEFQSMVSSSSQGSPHRLLISSRELPHLTRAFTKFPVISLSAERDYIDSAIRIFVQSGISEVFETLQNESDCVIEHSVRNQIETSLVQKANGKRYILVWTATATTAYATFCRNVSLGAAHSHNP
ncbi:MAG: hypothetical protein Q9157_006832 [Trypethelium eluteriae]